jgi:hypothetical protein
MTARQLFHRCRQAGINLGIDGDGVIFDAPVGVAVPVDEIRRIKPELLAMLRFDYAAAALALLASVPDPARREGLAHMFDERAGICQFAGGMDRGEAERQAYIELALAMETHSSGDGIERQE